MWRNAFVGGTSERVRGGDVVVLQIRTPAIRHYRTANKDCGSGLGDINRRGTPPTHLPPRVAGAAAVAVAVANFHGVVWRSHRDPLVERIRIGFAAVAVGGGCGESRSPVIIVTPGCWRWRCVPTAAARRRATS